MLHRNTRSDERPETPASGKVEASGGGTRLWRAVTRLVRRARATLRLAGAQA